MQPVREGFPGILESGGGNMVRARCGELPGFQEGLVFCQRRFFVQRCHRHFRAGQEIALQQHQRTAAALLRALDGRVMGNVRNSKFFVESDVFQCFLCQSVPMALITGLFGNRGHLFHVQAFAGSQCEDQPAAVFQNKGDCHGAEQLRQILLGEKGIKSHGLGQGIVTDAVDGTGVFSDADIQVVADRLLGIALGLFHLAQDSAEIFTAGQDHHAAAIRGHTGAAGNAAHIPAAQDLALGIAVADISRAPAGDTAHIIGLSTFHRARIGAGLDQSHGLPAGDAAYILLFAGNGAPVLAVQDHRSDFALDVQGRIAVFHQIFRNIQIRFQSHGACNAAHIQIRQDRTQIYAAFRFGGQQIFRILVGNVSHRQTQILGGTVQGVVHFVELAGDGLQIAAHSVRGALRCR